MTNTVNTTSPIQQRPGLVPVLRYGNFAGEGYAGRLGLETTIQHPDINAGNPIDVKELVQTPQGLASFMKVTVQTEPNGYLDAVTRNHDVEYTVAEMRYMNNVQAAFDGKLPHELTWEDKQTSAFKQLEGARNDEYWKADQRMLNAVAEYHPEDFADTNYRGLLLNAFYVKAESGWVGYGKTEEAANFYQELKLKDERIEPLSTGQAVLTFHRANTLAQANFEELATLPITPQERQFFNQHLLQPGASLDTFTKNQEGMSIPDGQMDYTHRLVVPKQMSDGIFESTVKMGDQTVTMRLDVTNKNDPVFTKVTTVNGEVVSEQVITAIDDKKEGQFNIRAYTVVTHDGQGNLLENSTIEKPPVPKLDTPEDLQAKIDAVKSGNYREVVAEVQTNPHSADAVNGMDLQSDQTHKANEGATQTKTDDAADQTAASDNDSSNATQQVTDAFSQADKTAADIKTQYPHAVQVADASGALPDASAHASTNTFNNYLDTQGNTLSSKQQDALATQIDKLGLGGEGDLSFYSLPGGGALIANADGDIVGEINRNSATGDLQLKANGIDANGNPVEVNNHIGEQGQVLSDAAVVQAQASYMFNSLMAVNNWDHMNDLGKLSALVNLYNATDKLGEAFGATGNNLPGDLGAAAGYLQLAQGLQSGDDLIITNGLNTVSDGAVDQAIGNVVGQELPYVSTLLELRNFADNPEQAALTMAGTYVGEAIGMAIGGPIGAAIGGAIGGMIGGSLGSMFGDDDIPMREGLAHAQWDANGHTQVVTTQDAEGGGATAHSWMSSLVSGLQASLDHTVDANGHAQYSLVPNLLPSVGFKYDPDGYNLANGARGFTYLEWTYEQGQTQTRYYDGAGNRGDGSGETLSGDFVQHAQSAIAPAWQVQTVLAHYQQSGEIDLPAQTHHLPTELSDGLHQTLQVVTLELSSALPTEPAQISKLIDVDGDGYLEQTQWLQTNQALLAVDLNGDGQIGLGETVNLQDADQVQHARTSMAWLDANSDGKLTAQDPAFAALKLWVDVNSDGKSANGELQTLSQAGITAIDFSTHPPSIERADGSQQALTVQTLTADTLGVALQQTTGGVLETREQQDGSGTRVLYAVNSQEFDGQADKTHGGDQDIDGSNGDVVQVDASRLATTTNNTIGNSSTQTSTTVGVGDARLKSLGTTAAANTSQYLQSA
jgi:hypothetical protein